MEMAVRFYFILFFLSKIFFDLWIQKIVYVHTETERVGMSANAFAGAFHL